MQPAIAPEPQAAAREHLARSSPTTRPRPYVALQSLVAARAAEGWHIALFQNTPAQCNGRPEAVEEHAAEIERVRAAGETVG